MANVKLFGNWASPFSRRIENALNLKGIGYEYIEEAVYVQKSPLLLKYNPIHKKVPVLVHNGKPVCESYVILEYIDETFEGPSILPKDPYQRALIRFWAKFLDDKCGPAMWNAAWSTGEEQQALVEEACGYLKLLEEELNGKKFFGGDTIGLVDIMANFIAYWIKLLYQVVGLDVLTKEKFPNLFEWTNEFVNDSTFKDNLPDKNRLTAYFQAEFQAMVDDGFSPLSLNRMRDQIRA